MNIFKSRKKQTKIAVLSIDGMPFTFAQKMAKTGKTPNLASLLNTGTCKRMNSVYPTVSSVAWSSFMTGVNPGSHNIYGFIDREPNPFNMFIPTSAKMKTRTLWEFLSDKGKKVVVINVPVTYPPRKVNGILIGCFLATSLDRIVYPAEYSRKLKDWGYRIDADAWLGRKDKEKFLEDIHLTLDKRMETGFKLMDSEEWDYFHLHIMESDRISHFLWEQWETGDPQWAPRFEQFWIEVDRYIAEFQNRLDKNTRFIVLSDHGFCSVKKEVYLNQWLIDNGYLVFNKAKPESLKEINPLTKAYSLIPGRIYLNLKGREWAGTIEQGSQQRRLTDELKQTLPEMTDPDTGEKIIQRVFTREEIYKGAFIHRAADLIAVPNDGYDIKGNLTAEKMTHKGELVGMHTYDDAFLYVDGMEMDDRQAEIIDVLPTIFKQMDVKIPPTVEGKPLL
ncbi:alkaline phosphatase family protein [bacterium]|nr:alkaline phosphatase family protein [FCB group bacterium]MBL7190932.1 alkaline phosphatase family protein [bacterium]